MVFDLSSTIIGAGLATLAAFGFAIQFLCIRIGTADGDVADAVLVTLLCNVVLVVPLVGVLYRGGFLELYTTTALVAFAGAGVLGLCLARICLFTGVKLIGASRTSPIAASNVLFATVFAYVFLGERVAIAHLAGIVLIVGGVAALSWETAANERANKSLRESGTAIAFPVAAALLIGVEPILISIGLTEGTPILAGLAMMILAGTIGFFGYWFITQQTLNVTWRGSVLWWYIGGGIATTVAFVAYLLALEVTTVVVAVPILQTSPLIVLVLSALFLPARLERITWRLVAAACVIVLGAAIVSVVG